MKVAVFTLFLVLSSHCKSEKVEPRIVGGTKAKKYEIPHQIALFSGGSFICGGAIIDRLWVLTAAHCVAHSGKVSTGLSILAGTNSLESGGVRVNVAKAIPHELYRNTTFSNDIAILKLEKPLKFNKSIQPIPLTTTALPASVNVIASGWGQTDENEAVSQDLLYVTLVSTTQTECYERFKLSKTICLAHKGKQGSCYGDSGGPANYNGKLVGLLNGSTACASKAPDFYADVFAFLGWINHTISKNSLSVI